MHKNGQGKTLVLTPALIVLTGPTASGKTDLALSLANKINAEIVNADSRQVYRYFNAATAKPTPKQRAEIPHHLYDIISPEENFDAGLYARLATTVISDINSRGKTALVCGGTGLYLNALINGLSELPTRNDDIRQKLNAWMKLHGTKSLHDKLRQVDPLAAEKIPAPNHQRVIRALEVYELTGIPLSQHWQKGRQVGLKPSIILYLNVSQDILRSRIEQRTKSMWPALLLEVSQLTQSNYKGDEPAFSSLGYSQALDVLKGRITDQEGQEQMIRVTIAYAKRQRTWFRHQFDTVSIDADGTHQMTFQNALRALEVHNETAPKFK